MAEQFIARFIQLRAGQFIAQLKVEPFIARFSQDEKSGLVAL
jgi:ABC-type glucose/galactose transport system permease subunit